jgi:predicted Zn-dependent protease
LAETAERELGAGQLEQASALLERALRIEPRNPTVWHYLGLASLELGNTAQADAMAAKSRSLVAGDAGNRRLRDWASRTLIEPARGVIDNWRERAARRAETRSQSIIIVDGRQYRRYGSNEPARRQR